MSGTILPISEHLVELRIRLMYIILSFFLTFLSCYYFSEQIFYLLAKPLLKLNLSSQITLETTHIHNRNFIYTDISEAFLTYIKVSFFFSLYICSPIIIYQIWIFLVPGLYKNERNKIAIFSFLSFILFTVGASLAYFFIFPVAWKFFLSFEMVGIDGFFNMHLQPKVDEYFSFVSKIIFLFGLSFQFPIYLILLVNLQIVSSNWFIKKRNFACVFSFIIAALLSPPDVFSQIILAIPLLLFYEISLFCIKLLEQYKIIYNIGYAIFYSLILIC